jgi:subtilisin family serine protease
MAVLPFLSIIFSFNFYFEIASGNAFSSVIKSTEMNNLQTYIIHVKQLEGRVFAQSEDRESWYRSFLPTTTASSDKQPQMVYSYHNVISGFVARLTQKEVRAMEEKDGFVSANPERILHLQTKNTPNFLGLHQQIGFWKESNFGKGVIIGVLDSGILPSHPSFSDMQECHHLLLNGKGGVILTCWTVTTN